MADVSSRTSDESGTSVRGRKKETTRDKLLAVATKLFLEEGFDNITVERISAEAGVSGRTFFRYFPTKEHAVFHDRAKRLALFRNSLKEAPGHDSPFDIVKSASTVVAEYYDGHLSEVSTEFKVICGSPSLRAEHHAAFRRMETSMARCFRQFRGKRFMTTRQSAMFAAAFLGAHRSMVWEWFAGGCKAPFARRLPEVFDVIDILADAIYIGRKP